MAALITEGLTKPNRATKGEPTTFANTKIVENITYNSAVKVDTACRSMFSGYHNLEEMIRELAGDQKNTVTDKWMQDVAETERLLKLGHKTAVRNVKKVLDTEGDEMEVENSEKGIGVQEELNMELRDGLRYAERGVKRMVKGLSKDEH